MNIKDIINKIKSIFSSKKNQIESSKDKEYRIQCEQEGRIEDFNNYLKYKKNAIDDIKRFKSYVEDGENNIECWKYLLKSKKSELEFIRPNDPIDIDERNYWMKNFYSEFKKVMPENMDLRFHGTSIFNTKSILESGGIFSSVDINDGYMTSTDVSGQISASTPESLDRTINYFADLDSYNSGLPCGCIFALFQKSDEDRKLKESSEMQAVSFKENPEQLYAIFTSNENILNVRDWLENAGLNRDLVYTFEGFLNKLKEEKNKPTSLRESLNPDNFHGKNDEIPSIESAENTQIKDDDIKDR